MVEGEDPILARDGEEVAEVEGNRRERGSAGIDQRAEDAGGESFAGARRSLEEGERAGGAESGEEPGKATDPGSPIREIEPGAKSGEGRAGVGGNGWGKSYGGARGLEEGVIAGGDVPSFSRNGDKMPVGIGEVEENFAGDGIRAASTHATPHGEALVITDLVGLGFEVIEDRVEGVRSGTESCSEKNWEKNQCRKARERTGRM